MRTPIAVLLSICTIAGCASPAFDPFEGPKPLAVFIQSDPWAMVIGSDTPRLAVYESGDVIFSRKVNDRLSYRHVTLDKAGLYKFRERLKPVLLLRELNPWYDIKPDVTDQPEAMFFLHDGDRDLATSVYGLMARDTKLPGYTEFPGETNPNVPPEEILDLHKWMCDIDYPNSEEWTPKYVEVMFWDYSYAPDESIHWPKEWPSLDSNRAIMRGDSYSVFLDGTMLPKLREFLAKREGKGAVEIDGKKMAVSYRYTFPGEPIWRKAFDADLSAQDK